MNPQTSNTIGIKIEDGKVEFTSTEYLDSSHNKIKVVIESIWEQFRFPSYGNGPNHGRSVLEDQLRNIDSSENRDCKLPTFIASKILETMGFETVVLVSENNGTHPYLCVRMAQYDNLVYLVSFHPENFVCTWLTWQNGDVVKWGNSLGSYAENNGYIILQSEKRWDILDTNFLEANES